MRKKMLLGFNPEMCERIKLVAAGRGQTATAYITELVARDFEARDMQKEIAQRAAVEVARDRIAKRERYAVPVPTPDPRARRDSFGRPVARTAE